MVLDPAFWIPRQKSIIGNVETIADPLAAHLVRGTKAVIGPTDQTLDMQRDTR